MVKPSLYCVLIVDDDEISKNLLSYLLESYGFATLQASNGYEALKMVEEHTVDLILLDIVMPEMNGMDMLVRLRERYPQHHLPVLMITGKTDSTSVIRALKMGANDYITKPIEDFDIVLVRVENQLRIREAIQKDSFEHLIPPQPTGYCPSCLLGLPKSERACPDCGCIAPLVGWPLISESQHRYLGKSLAGRYTLKRPLGIGSAGVVYSAFDQKLGRMYAVKIIEGLRTASSGRYRALQLEISAMTQLHNSHVVKLHEVVEFDEDAVALVMDLVHGVALDTMLADRGRLDVEFALNITRQVAQGLHEAHLLGVVHRDMKPDNVMLEALPVGGHMAKILDFGIAQVLGDSQESGFYGTPDYVSPEQIQRDEHLDHRADIYSIGAMLYHMLQGTPPFSHHAEIKELLTAHLYEDVPALSNDVATSQLRGKLDRFLRKMMAKLPDSRFQNLQEVYIELENMLGALRQPGRAEEMLSLVEYEAYGNSTQLGKPVETTTYSPLDLEPIKKPARL